MQCGLLVKTEDGEIRFFTSAKHLNPGCMLKIDRDLLLSRSLQLFLRGEAFSGDPNERETQLYPVKKSLIGMCVVYNDTWLSKDIPLNNMCCTGSCVLDVQPFISLKQKGKDGNEGSTEVLTGN